MNRYRTYRLGLLPLFAVLLLTGCLKEELEPAPDPVAPVEFELAGTLDGEPWDWKVGENGCTAQPYRQGDSLFRFKGFRMGWFRELQGVTIEIPGLGGEEVIAPGFPYVEIELQRFRNPFDEPGGGEPLGADENFFEEFIKPDTIMLAGDFINIYEPTGLGGVVYFYQSIEQSFISSPDPADQGVVEIVSTEPIMHNGKEFLRTQINVTCLLLPNNAGSPVDFTCSGFVLFPAD